MYAYMGSFEIRIFDDDDLIQMNYHISQYENFTAKKNEFFYFILLMFVSVLPKNGTKNINLV
jgi:hypothetical protein